MGKKAILALLFGVVVALLIIIRLPFGKRLLFRAAQRGHSRVVRVLVTLGSRIDAHDESGGTALFYAAANGYTETVRSLLALGSDATAVDRQGNTALCSALDTVAPNEEIVELLAKSGALVKQAQHGNPLFCIEHRASSVPYIGLLLNLGVDANAVDSSGYTPLMKFAYDGNAEAVSTLIQHGATVNGVATDGRSALSEAVVQGNDPVVEMLLKVGADPAIEVNGLTLADVAKGKKASFQAADNQIMISRYDRILELLAHASNAS